MYERSTAGIIDEKAPTPHRPFIHANDDQRKQAAEIAATLLEIDACMNLLYAERAEQERRMHDISKEIAETAEKRISS